MNPGLGPGEFRWSEVTAVFGGTFDPPHLGHRVAVEGLFKNPGVKQVLIIPSADPPLKESQVPTEHRLRMVELNFAGLSGVRIDICEIERSRRRPGERSYTIDTLKELRGRIPQLAFVLGVDQLEQMHRWHRFPEVLSHSHWIVLGRRPGGLEKARVLMQGWAAQGMAKTTTAPDRWIVQGKVFQLVATEAPEVSSTAVRETIGRTGQPPAGQLSGAVEAYLKANSLYGTEKSS